MSKQQVIALRKILPCYYNVACTGDTISTLVIQRTLKVLDKFRCYKIISDPCLIGEL
jgi:hypothetical protein